MNAHERFSDNCWIPSWIRYQHLERYRWACAFAGGKTVVDAACGSGYGSAMLACAGATMVHGYDLCATAVKLAARSHPRDNLAFSSGDVTALPCEAGSVDLFVCFETLEHVVDDGAVIAEATRILRPGGVFLCSTPHRSLTNPGKRLEDKPFNPYHVREYTPREMQCLLSDHFSRVDWYGQSFYSNGWEHFLMLCASASKTGAVKVHQLRKACGWIRDRPQWHAVTGMPWPGVPEFLIACCYRK